ncbi:MAG TPA: hypothetical protein VMW08_00150 [Acidimicrobiales bacterium]|nr:hypothetical protein [Acidimicrobiales bacterium]
MTTWVVSGMPRSGTSMMMRALIAGGLEPYWNPDKDAELAKIAAPRYHPNPNGYFEPGQARHTRAFPRLIDGKLVKLMGVGPAEPRFRQAAPIRVVWMRRPPAEIRASHLATFGRCPPWTADNRYPTIAAARIAHQTSVPWVEGLAVVDYPDVTDPATRLEQFERLTAEGWPIDPEAAAATIDGALHRHRAEG